MKGGSTALLALLCAFACGDQVSVSVHVVTDFAPGVEFAEVETLRFEPEPTEDGPIDPVRFAAAASDDFAAGVEVARYDLRRANHGFQLTLVHENGVEMLSRFVRATVESSTSVTVELSRSCLSAICPGGGPDADRSLTQCAAGACTGIACSAENPDACPEPACSVDDDCTPGDSCAGARCDDGRCVHPLVSAGACEPGLVCSLELGCREPDQVH